MTIWRATFSDGWYPKLSPDGRYLLCGAGHASIVDLATTQVVSLNALLGYGQVISAGWLNATQAVVSAAPLADNHSTPLARLDAPHFNVLAPLGPSLNFNGVGANVWAGGNTKDVYVGDQAGRAHRIAAGYAATVDTYDGTVVFSIDVQNDPKLAVWKNGGYVRTFKPAAAPSRVLVGAGGYVGYGYYGPSWLNTPDNVNIEVSVTPERRESPALAFRHLGTVWLATTSDRGIFLRPFGVRDRAIFVPIPAVDVSVVSTGSQFVLASNTDKGKLTLSTVLADTALLPVPPLAPAPPPQPPEEFMEPWRITFDESYSKTIARGVGAVARCDIGNGVSVEWQKGADDTIHFAVYKDGTLQNRSSLPRHVEIQG